MNEKLRVPAWNTDNHRILRFVTNITVSNFGNLQLKSWCGFCNGGRNLASSAKHNYGVQFKEEEIGETYKFI